MQRFGLHLPSSNVQSTELERKRRKKPGKKWKGRTIKKKEEEIKQKEKVNKQINKRKKERKKERKRKILR